MNVRPHSPLRPQRFGWLLLLLLPALACQGLQSAPAASVATSSSRTPGPVATQSLPAEATARAEGAAVEPPSVTLHRNLVAFVTNDRNISVVDPLNGEITPITRDAIQQRRGSAEFRAYSQPTWAPDSNQLAFVQVQADGNGPLGNLVVANLDFETQSPIFTSTTDFPFYLYWSPDSRQVSFLANNSEAGGGLALQVASVAAGESNVIDMGQPYYWHWAPDSASLVAHVGGQSGRLATLTINEVDAVQLFDLAPGAFQAPAWSPAGDQLLLAATLPSNETALVITDLTGEIAQTIATLAGPVAFGWSPDGEQVAFIQGRGQTTVGALNILMPAQPTERQYRDEEGVVAFFWSPDGRQIAYFIITDTPFGFERQAVGASGRSRLTRPAIQTATIYLELRLFDLDSGDARSLASFEPTDEFFNIIPFFDQYQHSATIWSPDSQSLVVGAVTEGESGLWMIDSGGGQPRFLTEGLVGFFSGD